MHQANTAAREEAAIGIEGESILLEQLTEDHTLAWLRLKQQVETELAEPSLYQPAFHDLCADSGIQHSSPGSSNHHDEIRFLIEHRQTTVQWEMGAWYFELSEFELLELIRFEHEGQCYIKTIHEPYPNGYPAELVKNQMIDLLEELSSHSDPNDPYFGLMFTTAHAMYQAAAQDLHSISHQDMTTFLKYMTTELDDPAVADYLLRSATGHQPELGMLLTPYGEGPPPLAEPRQVNTMLKAGRKTGMSNVQLWELALLMGARPEEHQLAAPTVSEDSAEALEQAAEKCGLPSITTMHWRKLFNISRDATST